MYLFICDLSQNGREGTVPSVRDSYSPIPASSRLEVNNSSSFPLHPNSVILNLLRHIFQFFPSRYCMYSACSGSKKVLASTEIRAQHVRTFAMLARFLCSSSDRNKRSRVGKKDRSPPLPPLLAVRFMGIRRKGKVSFNSATLLLLLSLYSYYRAATVHIQCA